MRRSFMSFGLVFIIFGLGGCAGCAPEPKAAPQKNIGIGASPATGVDSPRDVVSETRSPSFDGAALTAAWVPRFSKLRENTSGQLNVLLALDGAQATPNMPRPPLDLAMVIDTSGSMSGAKIESVKIAVLEMLKQLGPNDRVTLIAYANYATLRLTQIQIDERGIDLLRQEVLSLTAQGGTALGPALLLGLSILEGSLTPHRIAHLMLLSDGVANIGESRPDVLGKAGADGFEKGISISTLGVGLDYNEDLMTHLSDQGGGQYHFIDENEKIAAVLEDEMRGLTAAAAREIQVTLTLGEHSRISHVFGYPFTSTDNKTVIKVGTLRAGQHRDILLQLAHGALKGENLPIGTAAVRFKNMLDNETVDTVLCTLTVDATPDEAAAAASENTAVTVRAATIEGAAELAKAARAVDTGDFNQAALLLGNTIVELKAQAARVPSKELTEQITEMEQAQTQVQEAKSSITAQKYYVKKAKSSAYTKSKAESKSKIPAKSGRGSSSESKKSGMKKPGHLTGVGGQSF